MLDIPPLTWAVVGAAAWIFVLRVIGISLSTVRVLAMMRGKRLVSVVMGFFEVLVYVIAIGQVVANLSNVWNILGYCLGFSVGTLVGMWLDERTAGGYSTVRIISRQHGHHIAKTIREGGFGATVERGFGREGSVTMVLAIVRRHEVEAVCQLADKIDSAAFISIDETRAVRRGYMYLAQREK